MSQVRGLGQARPAPAASSGTASASIGRTVTNPAIQLRTIGTARSHPCGSAGGAGVGQPAEKPSATVRASTGQSRWQKRFARGGESSHPSAACSAGLAAATTDTWSGRRRSPTVRSRTTRSSAACTAGGAVETSSKNTTPSPALASATAHDGGANETRPPSPAPSSTIGRPAKSDGSLIDAITVSHGQPASAAIARMTDVLPVPGAPHRSTGTRAEIAIPSASTAAA